MNIITLDFETYFDDNYTLSKMTTEAYIRDPRFEVHGCGVKENNKSAFWVEASDIRRFFPAVLQWRDGDEQRAAALCHHAAFDGLILSHHYGIKPARWLDTYSMAQYLFGANHSKSLASLAERFALAPKNVPYDLMKGRHWADFTNAEQRTIEEGCLHDCELTLEIFNKMVKGDY